MIAFIDNKDSFTFNIVQSLERVSGDKVCVFRSEESSISDIEAAKPSHIVVGPGPGRPSEAGISIEAIRHFAGKLPILGICLGHQAIGEAFGAKIVGAKYIRHGIVEEIKTDGRGIFRTIGLKGSFTRYHSLVVDESTLPEEFEVSARAKDGDVMGIRHKKLVIEGVQFHPESIASEKGDALFKAFLNYSRENISHVLILNQLIDKKEPLSREQTASFIGELTDGTMDEKIASSVLTAMASRGLPTAEEMGGAAEVMLKKKTKFPLENHGLAEIVGTGGDGKGSFNISSLSALVASSCGQVMAKHGNRAVSSKSGAADFFEALGINIMAKPEKTAELIKKTGFGFLMAPVYHSAMRFAAPIRKALGIKTIFNVLGPLLNPANAEYEVLGVYSKDLLKDYAHAAKSLGAKRVMVVNSEDGYDEISPCALTNVYQIDEKGNENQYVIDPKNFGITDADENELYGGNGSDNAKLAMEVLNGEGRRTIRYAVGLNAGAVLYLCGKARTLKDGYNMALEAIDSGKTLAKLQEIQSVSKQLSPQEDVA
ncbi:MAG: bifunctional anthranilate synthase component II/anthranilate phosphoribosyltransferase [Treponema sp.]|uniref:bifunctional anthranilate synthase component II/anthranilate phosphoribosyltransferase n=1 Tax=Treponema sp. TaxID=166 RepID=UPI0025F453D0|nr:bifunctional anthranilate synthase component II/anthranilate phosphoribosyltransferase [Treponema sp.]MBQ8678609.1 bifunctional anthranilate synthase component II/anthranilate phosphoribosyltransferase [Treponema sp.]